MRSINAISEDAVIAAFLKAEITSPRYMGLIVEALKKYNVDRTIIDTPDLTNEPENTLRLTVLDEYRHYKKRGELFEGFPDDVQWESVALTKEDLLEAKYIDYDYWVELSGGSRLAVDATQLILRGIKVFGKSTVWALEGAKMLKEAESVPPMIFVSTHKGGDLVVLEGHARLTAYLLALADFPGEVEAIVGYSRNMVKWTLF